MTSGNAWRAEKRTRRTLTDLNRATSAAYNACRMNGGHVPSGDTVIRQYPGKVLSLPVCESCGVPYGGPAVKRWGEQPI